MTAPTHDAVHAMGYDVLPILPPGCEPSPGGTLAWNLKHGKDGRGKAPGYRNGGDGWSDLAGWQTVSSSGAERAKWTADGAGIGIRPGETVIGFDADAKNDEAALLLRAEIEAVIGGKGPLRVGQSPKALYLARLSAPVEHRPKIKFDGGEIDFRTGVHQFVAFGTHAVTGKPYRWFRPLVPAGDLPVITSEQLDALHARLKAVLPNAVGERKTSTINAGDVNQDALRGDPAAVAKAIRALPNDRADYDRYIAIGYALKAALPDNDALAYDLWTEWAERHECATPTEWPGYWKSFKGPFKAGASWLYDEADKHSGGAFRLADAWFDVLPDEAAAPREGLRLLTLGDIMSRPPARWLIARHIPRVSMGFLYSEPGAGKSFLALDMALVLAHGETAWHGDAIDPDLGAQRDVVYIAAEGAYGFRNRIAAWMQQRGLPLDGSGAAGLLARRFLLVEETINFMKPEDVARLVAAIRGVSARPCLVVVDTVSRAMPGADENLQKDMTLFVRACDAARDAFGCAVLGIHHAGKSGDMRGSTVLLGAGDFVFRLTRKKGRPVGTLACEKQKDGPDGWEDAYDFAKVVLAAPEGLPGSAVETSITVKRIASGVGGTEEVLTVDRASAVLRAMGAAWTAKAAWGESYRTKERWAATHMAQRFGFSIAEAETTLKVWLATGVIQTEMYDTRNKRYGLRVLRDFGQDVPKGGVFD